jgi:hypothetical protein
MLRSAPTKITQAGLRPAGAKFAGIGMPTELFRSVGIVFLFSEGGDISRSARSTIRPFQ